MTLDTSTNTAVTLPGSRIGRYSFSPDALRDPGLIAGIPPGWEKLQSVFAFHRKCAC